MHGALTFSSNAGRLWCSLAFCGYCCCWLQATLIPPRIFTTNPEAAHQSCRSVNICGVSPARCTPEYELRTSHAAIVQFVDGAPPPCNTSAPLRCKDYDTLAPACCTNACYPIGAPAFTTMPLIPANVATGGLRLTYPELSPFETDVAKCPVPRGRNLEAPRHVSIVLQCEPATPGVRFDPVVASTLCGYSITAYSATACGVPIPSMAPFPPYVAPPSPTVSDSSSTSRTPARTRSSSRSSRATVSSSATASPSQSPDETPTPTPLVVGYYSSLDRDVGIGSGGVIFGVVCAACCVMLSHRRMFPWQWEGDVGGQQQRVALLEDEAVADGAGDDADVDAAGDRARNDADSGRHDDTREDVHPSVGRITRHAAAIELPRWPTSALPPAPAPAGEPQPACVTSRVAQQ